VVVPDVAWACKPADVEAFYADALAAARGLWPIAGVLCGLICLIDFYRRRLSKSAIAAVLATVLFPAWTLPSWSFVGCTTVNVEGAVVVDALLAVLLARRLWLTFQARMKPGEGA
jgi:hypothetical protein